MIIAFELSVEFKSTEEFDVVLVVVVMVVVVVINVDVVDVVAVPVVEIAVAVVASSVVTAEAAVVVDCGEREILVAVDRGTHVEQLHSGRAVEQSRQFDSDRVSNCKLLGCV